MRGSFTLDDLAQYDAVSILSFGKEEVFAAAEDYIDEYEAQVQAFLALLTEKTKERTMGIGGPGDTMVMDYVDEGGVADTQKWAPVPGVLGLPLRRGQINRQWTNDYFRRSSPADFRLQMRNVTFADASKLQSELKRTVYRPTNYTFTDRFRANEAIPVKAFANADGFPIPTTAFGTFDAATHTHYVGTANALPTEADLDAQITNVNQHGSTEQLIWVNETFGNALMAGGAGTGGAYPKFVLIPMPNVQYPNTATLATGQGTLDFVNANNRVIGLYNGRRVWVKPWAPALTVLVTASGQGVRKPIGWRIPDDLGGDNGNLRVVFNDYQHPNHVEMMEREFGFGVIDRVGASVLSYNSGGAIYVQPAGI